MRLSSSVFVPSSLKIPLRPLIFLILRPSSFIYIMSFIRFALRFRFKKLKFNKIVAKLSDINA